MLFFVSLLPLRRLSYLLGRLAHIELPQFLATPLVKIFANFYKINLEEAAMPLNEYRSIGHFFIRDLKPGLRPIGDGIVSPVDGMQRSTGTIENDQIIEAKGVGYSVGRLIGDEDREAIFEEGCFYNFYLSPPDYHHVHAPCGGYIVGWSYIPGCLYPVNDWGLHNVTDLFAVNERLVIYIESKEGVCAVVMVGALNVGKITLAFDSICTTDLWRKERICETYSISYDQPIAVNKGDRLGTFHLGSSVVLLFQQGACPNPRSPSSTRLKVRMGQSLCKS